MTGNRTWLLLERARRDRISGQNDGISECRHLLFGVAYLDPDEC
jgi:hypothetical protein